jgi:hypothetical protein
MNSMKLESTTDLMVVETEEDIFIGALDVDGDEVTIKTGLVGRPKVLHVGEIDAVTPAAEHPDVEWEVYPA